MNQVRATATTPAGDPVCIVLAEFDDLGPLPTLDWTPFRQVYITGPDGKIVQVLKDNIGGLS